MELKIVKNIDGKESAMTFDLSDDDAVTLKNFLDHVAKPFTKEITDAMNAAKPAEEKASAPAEKPISKQAQKAKEEGKVELDDNLIIDDGVEFMIDKSNYKEKMSITVKDGTLILKDDIDPIVKMENGILVYRGYTVEISEQQHKNIQAMSDVCEVALEDCYLNESLDLNDANAYIDGGAYEQVSHGKFDDQYGRITPELCSFLKVSNGAKIDHLINYAKGILYVNSSDYYMNDDNTVTIDHLDVSGRAVLRNCRIDRLHVCYTGEAEVDGDINELDVCGTVFIKKAHINKIILHPGGRVFGDVGDATIEATERPMQYINAFDCFAG